jgi:4-carboxymuconolactone decarboxylase
MRRFEVLTRATMTPEQRLVADDIAAGRRSSAPLQDAGDEVMQGPFNAMLRSPEIGDRAQRLGEAVRFRSSLPPQLIELAILLTARRWTAQFEWYAHERLALEAGLAPETPAAIAGGERPGGLDAEQADVHDFVRELLETGSVSDERFDPVERRFGERGVVDLTVLVGYYTIVSFLLNVERHPVPDGDPPLDEL